jgi:hypothetical protein
VIAVQNTSEGTDSSGIAISQLQALRARMQAAFEQSKWQDLAELDNECRRIVTEVVSHANGSVLEALTEMLRFYASLLQDCRYSKNQIASQAITMRHAHAHGRHYHSMNRVK